jgi:hypothetical protein
MALFAGFIPADLYFSLLAERGFFKSKSDVGAGIAAALRA